LKKLFGTDGIRGVANRDLTPELAFRIGRITASLLREKTKHSMILIGRDTRLSGDMLEGALAAGITSAGVSVRLLGIIPTPGVAYLARSLPVAAGVVISASHNPIEYNGLKVFDHSGLKLSDEIEREIEGLYFAYDRSSGKMPRPEGVGVGRITEDGEAARLYLEHLKGLSSPLLGMRLVIDCGYGAAGRFAGELLEQLGAKVSVLHGEPDGERINVNCGATDTAILQREVPRRGADAGLAFDGDADRLIAVDEKGSAVDGDAIMSICAIDMMQQGTLKNSTLVATVMSNGGLDLLAEQHGFRLVRAAVGDRYVLEEMLAGGYNLGGEQSGHIIFSDHSTTGDGLLTALRLLSIVARSGLPLSELAGRLRRIPQVLYNLPITTQKGWLENPIIAAAIDTLRGKLGQHSRILVRASGTEPLIRIMLEAPLPEEDLWEEARRLAGIIAREQG